MNDDWKFCFDSLCMLAKGDTVGSESWRNKQNGAGWFLSFLRNNQANSVWTESEMVIFCTQNGRLRRLIGEAVQRSSPCWERESLSCLGTDKRGCSTTVQQQYAGIRVSLVNEHTGRDNIIIWSLQEVNRRLCDLKRVLRRWDSFYLVKSWLSKGEEKGCWGFAKYFTVTTDLN